jgi:hypothetical protein
VKTNELTGPALDWAVAKCEGNLITFDPEHHTESGSWERYSTDWAQGGPIIEREGITVGATDDPDTPWTGWHRNDERKTWACGPTPLIAAMRCFVASKLGEEVDIPEELK